MTRLYIATLGTETNTFAPIPTGMRSFEETMLYRGDATRRAPNLFTEALHVWRRRGEAEGWEVVEGLAAFAQPAGPTVQPVWEALRDEVVEGLRAAGGADVVLIQCHGAMVSSDCDDCEGELMAALRAVAPGAVIGLEIDPHCHLTDRMLEACDLIVCFKEYPHVDATPRAEELFTLAADTLAGRVRPVMRMWDCRMIGMYRTPMEPVRGFVDAMMAAEGTGDVLSLSLAHGFPYGDTPWTGTRMLAIADGDAGVAARAAEEWGRRLIAMREEASQIPPGMGEAVARAAAHNGAPLVLADMSDNAGGGAPSDATFLLRAVLEKGIGNVASGIYWDPVVTRLCAEAGVGASLDVRLGGKVGPMSGEPMDLRVTVRGHGTGLTMPFGGGEMEMGEAVWLETGDGIDLVVNDTRTQCFHPAAFEKLGIRLAEKRLVLVKSSNHFYAGFAPIAAEVIHVGTPGALPADFRDIPFVKRARDWWPAVADPWA